VIASGVQNQRFAVVLMADVPNECLQVRRLGRLRQLIDNEVLLVLQQSQAFYFKSSA
jgi:hypothetical protein